MNKIGILAFGSLRHDSGDELCPLIERKMKTRTPFPVEYGRYSRKKRGGAPTLVPHPRGGQVDAEILVLNDSVSVKNAMDMLWRRETGETDKTKGYPAGTSPNSVQVACLSHFEGIEVVLYTDFHDAGKIPKPTASDLAMAAIQSVAKANANKDGITYLIAAISSGTDTPLTKTYCEEIQRQTGARSLPEARDRAKKINPAPAS